MEPFRKYLAENSVTVNQDGVDAGKQAVIAGIEDHPCQVEGYSFSDWAVHQVSDDAAILTYRATQNAVCGGEKIPENVVVSATYVRRDGNWLSASYHETPAKM